LIGFNIDSRLTPFKNAEPTPGKRPSGILRKEAEKIVERMESPSKAWNHPSELIFSSLVNIYIGVD
jgi:hypothetical protein